MNRQEIQATMDAIQKILDAREAWRYAAAHKNDPNPVYPIDIPEGGDQPIPMPIDPNLLQPKMPPMPGQNNTEFNDPNNLRDQLKEVEINGVDTDIPQPDSTDGESNDNNSEQDNQKSGEQGKQEQETETNGSKNGSKNSNKDSEGSKDDKSKGSEGNGSSTDSQESDEGEKNGETEGNSGKKDGKKDGEQGEGDGTGDSDENGDESGEGKQSSGSGKDKNNDEEEEKLKAWNEIMRKFDNSNSFTEDDLEELIDKLKKGQTTL